MLMSMRIEQRPNYNTKLKPITIKFKGKITIFRNETKYSIFSQILKENEALMIQYFFPTRQLTLFWSHVRV